MAIRIKSTAKRGSVVRPRATVFAAKAMAKPAAPVKVAVGKAKAENTRRAYDADKDETIAEVGIVETGSKNGDLYVAVKSWNNGPKKVAFYRTGERADGSRWFSKEIGRLTSEEAVACAKLLAAAAKLAD